MHPEVASQTRELIAPPPRLKISEWTERKCYIPKDGNAESGKYHLRRMPWQRDMLDDPLDPNVQEIFWMMASQYAGKSLCMIFITLYRIAVLQSSTIVIYSTIKSAKRWIVRKFMKVANATPCMKGLIGDPRKRDNESTALEREYPGGALTALGANSTSDFRGTTADGVLQDEVDDYEESDEGDPCALGDRAAETFSNPVKLKLSTPKLKGSSRIDAGYESGDKQKYFVPCPCCGYMQDLQTEQMKFTFTYEEYERLGDSGDGSREIHSGESERGIERHLKTEKSAKGDIEKANSEEIFHYKGIRTGESSSRIFRGARTFVEIVNSNTWTIGKFEKYDLKKTIYVCEKCQKGWTDGQRIASIMSGHPDNPPVIVDSKELRAEWRATAPFNGIRSRHLNGMYALIGLKQSYSSFLHMFADKFVKAKKGGTAKFQVWVNTFKTEAYEDEAEKIEWKDLFDRREEYGPGLPDQVVIVVGMMDIQLDRVEITSLGWGDEQEAWVLDIKVIYGDFDMPEMRDRVEDHLTKRRFSHRVIGELPYEMVLIDSRFKTKAVYKFCKKHAMLNYFAIKGVSSDLGAIYTVRNERAFQIKIFNLNVDYLKGVVAGHLRNKIEAGMASHPNTVHFPNGTDFNEKYFAGVCSEKLVKKKMPDGRVKSGWFKITSSIRNEPWDLLVYGFGAFEIMRKAGKVEWIARKWKEVQAKLRGMEPQVPKAPKEYILHGEAKEPEMPQQPSKAPMPPQKPKPYQRPFRRGGMWNPLKF